MEKNMNKVRKFGGKTEFSLDCSTPQTLEASKRERHFHQRMLRAYLKGKTHFNFGFERTIDNRLKPITHEVLVIWEDAK